ncbi:MAG: DNA polymerase III subunit delta [Bacteroidaceae bacterium]|nr:DNA polymerase III subunit delta [Bacteroidaceae bacterium]
MTFDDIIGQEDVKRRLLDEYEQGRVPHALMLCGVEGCGAMPIALAYAQMLLGGGVMAEKLQHPDLHFVFPIYKKTGGKDSYCDDFVREWRELLLTKPYFGMSEWMNMAGAENQQLIIYANESEAILRKLSLKSSQGGYKVMVVWLPEKMHVTCANKILKLLEEPPAQTVFLLVSEQPDQVLQTIRSRTQMVQVPRLTEEDVREALVSRYAVQEADARRIARSCGGNMAQALRTITYNSESEYFFELFVELMRLSYVRRVKEMKVWSEKVAGMGRERVKAFLEYCQRMLRENFIYNFGRQSELNYMNEQEVEFAVRFAPYINERNVIGIMNELSLAQRDIAQNTNAKIVFFDFALKMIVLIKNR